MAVSINFHREFHARKDVFSIRQELVSADEYIAFLSRSDLGSQYPLEDFRHRIGDLVQNVQISLIARDRAGKIVGICFALTDFAYWLLVTDLGVDRDYVKHGLGRELMRIAHELAGGERKIIQFAYANDAAIPFYEKLGMEKSTDMMEKSDVDWTPFRVEDGGF